MGVMIQLHLVHVQVLTGQPCEVIRLKSKKKPTREIHAFNWNKVLQANSSHYLMSCLCSSKTTKLDQIPETVGLIDKHIYSILDVREFIYKGRPLRLLKMRNPWGKKEWKGAWSNNWPFWPSEIKNQIIIDRNNTGQF